MQVFISFKVGVDFINVSFIVKHDDLTMKLNICEFNLLDV